LTFFPPSAPARRSVAVMPLIDEGLIFVDLRAKPRVLPREAMADANEGF
jgi:hypothetical protein